MFVILALLAIVNYNYKNKAFAKEDSIPSLGNENVNQGDSSNSDGGSSQPEGGNSTSAGDSSESSGKLSGFVLLIAENLNDILNNGINKATIYKYFEDEADYFFDDYKYYADIALNKSYVPFPDKTEPGLYSIYFDVDKTLYSVSQSVERFLSDNKETFSVAKPILNDISQNLERVLNLDKNIIQSLYDYILINSNNDKVKFGEIFNKLGISTNWVEKVKKIVSFVDAEQPISVLVEGLNVQNEYTDFYNKIEKLKLPSDNETRFLSIGYVTDAISSGFKLIRAIYNNNVKTYYNDPIVSVIKKYGLNPANIFERSVNERATALNSLLTTIKGYSTSCGDEANEEPLDELKCLVHNYVQSFLYEPFCEDICGFNEEDYSSYCDTNQTCLDSVFDTAKNYVSDYTASEINITNIFANKYKIDPYFVRFYAGLAADLTDPTKNYVDILQRTASIFQDVEVFRDIYYPQFVNMVKDVISFIGNLGDSSNFRNIFSTLGLTNYWDIIKEHVQEISTEKPVCNLTYVKYEEEYNSCVKLCDSAKSYIALVLSSDTLEKFVSEGIGKMAVDFGIIPLRSITQSLSTFLKSTYDHIIPQLKDFNFQQTAEFSSAFNKIFGTLDESVTLFDELFPSFIKELPVVSQYYPQFIQKTHDILNAFKTDQTLSTIFNNIYDGTGVFFNMLQSAATTYKDEKTIISDVIKGIKPTSFINVYETALKINQTNNITLHAIAQAITYDGSNSVAKLLAGTRTLSINDLFPIKSLILNSGDLYQSMRSNRVGLDIVSKCLAVSKESIIEFFSSLIKPVFLYPYDYIKSTTATYLKTDENQANSVYEKIRSICSSVEAGRLISTHTSGIVVTPVATPAQTKIPIEENIKVPNEVGSIDFSGDENVDMDTVNTQIVEEFKKNENGNNNDINYVNLNLGDKDFVFNGDLELGEGQYIRVESKNVDYKGGDLKMYFDDVVEFANIKVEDASNVKISLQTKETEKYISEPPETKISIKTNNDNVKNIMLTSSSDLARPVTLSVPDSVESITIDSVSLHRKATISATKKNSENERVPITVKKLDVDSDTECTLSKLTVENEFKITQSAKLTFEDVTFKEDSQLNLDIRDCGRSGFDNNPIITGSLKTPPGQINFDFSSSKNDEITYNHDYLLFRATFESGGCERWKNNLQLDGSKFTESKCTDWSSGSAFDLATEQKELNVRTNKDDDDGGNKGNKLGPGPIAGIVVGVVVVIAIIVVVVVVVVIKKKKNKDQSSNENGKDDDADL